MSYCPKCKESAHLSPEFISSSRTDYICKKCGIRFSLDMNDKAGKEKKSQHMGFHCPYSGRE